MDKQEFFMLSTQSKDGGLTHEHALVLARTPWMWTKIADVAEWVCSYVFRDRWCLTIAGKAMKWAADRTEEYSITLTEQQAFEIHVWRYNELPWWTEEEDEVAQELAAEAERGYDIEQLRRRNRGES